ncbi:MAG: hypothetical protein A2148_04465 [Chloroflexi bacterium RBG_16_68_14]|nr:MAG: hypothetical protein A2148_04465 [Chloroflexi bacterium RBG_16_68_14]
MEFTTESIFQALKSPLGVIDNAERRKQLEGYIEAARLALERSVFDLLSRFAQAVNGQVSAHYEVDLSYRPGVLELDVRAREPSEPVGEVWSLAEGEVEKITLRIPAELKDLATEAAARAGLSVNAWFVRVLARALRAAEAPEPPADLRRGPPGRPGQRLTGWVGTEL